MKIIVALGDEEFKYLLSRKLAEEGYEVKRTNRLRAVQKFTEEGGDLAIIGTTLEPRDPFDGIRFAADLIKQGRNALVYGDVPARLAAHYGVPEDKYMLNWTIEQIVKKANELLQE